MARRRSFVPESPIAGSLEGRIAPSTFGSIGDWFSSQYSHVKQDLGITHKKANNAAKGIIDLWAATNKPAHAAHATPAVHVTSNDTVPVK